MRALPVHLIGGAKQPTIAQLHDAVAEQGRDRWHGHLEADLQRNQSKPHDRFAEESLPPTLLFHVPDQQLVTRELVSEGRELIETMKCARCHAPPEGVYPQDAARWNSAETAGPSLKGVASRLKSDWVRDHLLAPAPNAGDPLTDWSATGHSQRPVPSPP